MGKHNKASQSAVSGTNNIINQGSVCCNLDLELISYFRQLSFREKWETINFMIQLHENKSRKKKVCLKKKHA